MALRREELDQVMKILADTSMRPEGEVKGKAFTVYQCIPEKMDKDAPLFVCYV